MPSISEDFIAPWSNYHLTSKGRFKADGVPDAEARVRDIARVHCADLRGASGPEIFSATAAMFQQYLDKKLEPRPLPVLGQIDPPEAIEMAGRGWSFSKLVGPKDLLIDMSGLANIAPVDHSQLSPGCDTEPENLAFVSGGTRLRELAEWARADGRGKSLPTSGTHLGPTIAGGFGTASHGSRLGFGGLQEIVRGIHLVTGPNKEDSVWVEPARSRVLNDETIMQISPHGKMVNDDIFDEVLIHLGAMGIVNGVLVELCDDIGFDARIIEKRIDQTWLKLLSDNRFDDIRAELNLKNGIEFYELTIDPFAWDQSAAIHNVYTKNSAPPTLELSSSSRASPDALALAIMALGQSDPIKNDPDYSKLDVFDTYKEIILDWEKQHFPRDNMAWADLHEDEITGGLPGSLWNASYAIDQANLAQAVPAICEAVKDLFPHTFLFTIRFVENASGTLAFTRFPKCAVIEIDGISHSAFRLPPELGSIIEDGNRRVRAALDQAEIDYSMHWAKLGNQEKEKVWRDFGEPADSMSRLGRWTDAREKLLTAQMRKLFWNQAVVELGLVEQP